MDAFAAYSEYMTGMIAERKSEPTDDLVSVLVHAEVEGSEARGPPDRHRGAAAADRRRRDDAPHPVRWHRQLLRHPDQHQRLVKDLDLLPNAIEEMLRWTAPVKNMARTITADTEFHGTALTRARR